MSTEADLAQFVDERRDWLRVVPVKARHGWAVVLVLDSFYVDETDAEASADSFSLRLEHVLGGGREWGVPLDSD